MGRAVRRITRGVRGVVDSVTGRAQADAIKEQQRAEEERLRREQEERKKMEQKQEAEEAYRKDLEQQQSAAVEAGENQGIDNTNVGLGDVKVDFGKLLSDKDDDEDKLKKALK